jgi:hypothetical protein
MFLSLPQITKGKPATVQLNKAALFQLSKISSDSYFSLQSNVKTCLVVYKSSVSNQKEILRFDLSEAIPSASFLVSALARGNFELYKVILEDHDKGKLSLKQADLPSSLNITL